uniref:LIM zinc-binding domain-containing protein n=1 Tax=Lutzomyia longipalpis TaxID=7200 RepID=A0A1B0CH56_LUTLO
MEFLNEAWTMMSWHKACFKCHECGMTLNMKTYKGFNKLPYCEAHIPKAKATTIADTPELKRIAENTKIQSNVQYHAEFEKQKGKVTQVADDPETLRIKQNTMHISNVAYHGDLEKKAAMEKQREAAEVSDTYTRDCENSVKGKLRSLKKVKYHHRNIKKNKNKQTKIIVGPIRNQPTVALVYFSDLNTPDMLHSNWRLKNL